MAQTHNTPDSRPDPRELPFVAPCRTLDRRAPWRWLRRGWQDFLHAPRQSLSHGLIVVLLVITIGHATWRFGNLGLFLGLVSGFVFLGPVLALGLYSISCQLARGYEPRLGYCLREGRRNLGNVMVFAVILLVVFLVWARAASMVHVFFPVEADPHWRDLVVFLGVGSVVGAVFAAIVFAASAFSLPMILDRKVDTITAVLTSVNAVRCNTGVMALWAVIIGLGVLVGLLTAGLGFALVIPVIGHATWHAYRETIVADDWPEQPESTP